MNVAARPVDLLLLGSLILVGASFPAHTQTAAPSPACQSPQFRQFDFWIGEWEVRDPTGKLAGHNAITREQGGCLILERWRGVNGAGMSMNYYDPDAGRWKQHWVSPGIILEMSGTLQGESLVLEGPLQYIANGQTTLLRGTWTPLPDGRVRQHFVESKDGGKTWTDWFDGYYSRTRGGDG